MNKAKLKSLAYSIGKFLGLLGLAYLFYTLSQEYTFASFSEQFIHFTEILPLLILINFISILLGIYAWQKMLNHYATKPLDYTTAYYYFSKTEIAKYLPGNVFHYVGRQTMATSIGLNQKQMAKTSLLSALLLLTSTVLTSTLFAFFSQEIAHTYIILMIVATILSFALLSLLYKSFPFIKKIILNIYLGISIALQGILLSTIVMYQSESFSLSLFLLLIAIYTVSWLIGFVTPGASGGLGVREGAFIAIITYFNVDASTDIILFSVLLVRLINILGDILLYLSTWLLKNKIKEVKI